MIGIYMQQYSNGVQLWFKSSCQVLCSITGDYVYGSCSLVLCVIIGNALVSQPFEILSTDILCCIGMALHLQGCISQLVLQIFWGLSSEPPHAHASSGACNETSRSQTASNNKQHANKYSSKVCDVLCGMYLLCRPRHPVVSN